LGDKMLVVILLGIVQGLLEPIPVSSSGHIFIFKTILEKFREIPVDTELFAILSNFGSLIAILIIFWKDIIKLIKSFFGYLKTKDEKYKSDYKYCWYIVLATIPAGIMGLIVTKLDIFGKLEENIKFLGLMLVITAIFLFIVRKFSGTKTDKTMTLMDALTVGLFQVVALIPGISRSGSTLIGGMFRNLKREEAFRFSFMLYIPISCATMILGIKDLLDSTITTTIVIYYLIGMVMAFIFTLLTVKWFSKIVKEGKLIYFSIYCLLVGILVILFL